MFNDLDCQRCTKVLRDIRGCDGFKTPQTVSGLPGIEIDRCPVRYIGEKEILYIDAYHEYEHGFLPNSGGWLEQPMKFNEGMRMIKRLVAKFKSQKEKT